MLTTLMLLLYFICMVVATVIWGALLRAGLRWVNVANITTSRIVFVTITVAVLFFVLRVLVAKSKGPSEIQTAVMGLVALLAIVGTTPLIIAAVFELRFFRAFKASLPTHIALLSWVAFALFAGRSSMLETFRISSNAMAPTLLGKHWKAVCPACGRPNYCTPTDNVNGPRNESHPRLMICDNFHVREMSAIPSTSNSGDHVLVTKFLPPQRWDLVVFRYPADPNIVYVFRLVGLPGETIHIEDGIIWANGEKLVPPEAIRGITYNSQIPDYRLELWGSKERPAALGRDEYFVLGDFPENSADSRLWQVGADGYHPYAVPKSHIEGTATYVYWPFSRWRTLR